MLRFYKPIQDTSIYTLHKIVKSLVCNVWCKADQDSWQKKLAYEDLKLLKNYKQVISDIDKIYQECRKLNEKQKRIIFKAFIINNSIQKLCNGELRPITLEKLPTIVERKMKPFLKYLYEEILDRKKILGDKNQHYKALYQLNDFICCPSCCYIPFESHHSSVREAFDHYFPKSLYPFCSLNFDNLVPLCFKCNSERKKDKDPIKGGRRAFYPFLESEESITIQVSFRNGCLNKIYDYLIKNDDSAKLGLADIDINFSGNEQDKVETWNDLFEMSERYADRIGQISFRVLKPLRKKYEIARISDENTLFRDICEKEIEEWQEDIFFEEGFLKIPFIRHLNSLLEL